MSEREGGPASEKTLRDWFAAQALVPLNIQAIIRDVCELPDRTSPEDQPEMMLVTGEELNMILSRYGQPKPSLPLVVSQEMRDEFWRVRASYRVDGLEGRDVTTDMALDSLFASFRSLPAPPRQDQAGEGREHG